MGRQTTGFCAYRQYVTHSIDFWQNVTKPSTRGNCFFESVKILQGTENFGQVNFFQFSQFLQFF